MYRLIAAKIGNKKDDPQKLNQWDSFLKKEQEMRSKMEAVEASSQSKADRVVKEEESLPLFSKAKEQTLESRRVVSPTEALSINDLLPSCNTPDTTVPPSPYETTPSFSTSSSSVSSQIYCAIASSSQKKYAKDAFEAFYQNKRN